MSVTVTTDWLMANRTRKGGWTDAQLKVLGTSHHHGWIGKVQGMVLSDEAASRFIAASREYSPKTIKMRAKEQVRASGKPPVYRIDGEHIHVHLTAEQEAAIAYHPDKDILIETSKGDLWAVMH